ncbi:MAG TPA: hypothetical protein VMU80_16355 [Bryobacteraceae bacterium]|nr:hypothetical protein [Bryobacteraceae bacterium]
MLGWREAMLAVWSVSVFAQPPAIDQNGVTNAAARIPSTLPGGGIARGARLTIRGVRLAADRAGIRVSLHHGSHVLPLPIESDSPLEVDAWMPSKAPLGDAALFVENSDGSSRPFAVQVVTSQLGLFAVNGQGWGRGKVDNVGARGEATPNSPAAPARPGQMAAVLATGLGNARQVEIVVGGRSESAASIQRDYERGVERIRFRVPQDSPLGCFVPIYARTRGTISNIVTMAVAKPGSECTQLQLLFSTAPAVRTGMIALTRTATLFTDGQPVVTEDQTRAMFLRIDPAAIDVTPLSTLPPNAQCNGLTGDFHTELESLASFTALTGTLKGKELDVGPAITLTGAGSSRRVSRSHGSIGAYWSTVGMKNPSLPRAPALFLADTGFTIDGGGGADVGSFSRHWQGPADLEWINRADFRTIDRSRPATFLWRATAPDAFVVVAMISVDEQTDAGAICFCTARTQAGRLTVPPEMLAHFPATRRPQANQSASMVLTIRRITDLAPAIRGLDGLALISTFASVRRTDYR